MSKTTILITGANRGIGKQLALLYASPQTNLILIARNKEALAEVSRLCKERGANVIGGTLDIREASRLEQFLLQIDDHTPIDLIIANAGVANTLGQDWKQETNNDLQENFAINLHGTLNTINPLINRMITRQKGQIAIISSIAALRGLPHSPSYCASKAAINIYGQSLRAWLSRYNVRVNVIIPGYIKTDMSDGLIGPKPFLVSSEKAAKIIQHGLMRNKARISFPWQLHLLIKLATTLPSRVVDKVLNQFESYAGGG